MKIQFARDGNIWHKENDERIKCKFGSERPGAPRGEMNGREWLESIRMDILRVCIQKSTLIDYKERERESFRLKSSNWRWKRTDQNAGKMYVYPSGLSVIAIATQHFRFQDIRRKWKRWRVCVKNSGDEKQRNKSNFQITDVDSERVCSRKVLRYRRDIIYLYERMKRKENKEIQKSNSFANVSVKIKVFWNVRQEVFFIQPNDVYWFKNVKAFRGKSQARLSTIFLCCYRLTCEVARQILEYAEGIPMLEYQGTNIYMEIWSRISCALVSLHVTQWSHYSVASRRNWNCWRLTRLIRMERDVEFWK